MRRYSVTKERDGSKELEERLDSGWEPFAVTREPVYDNSDSPWRCTGEDSFVWLRDTN